MFDITFFSFFFFCIAICFVLLFSFDFMTEELNYKCSLCLIKFVFVCLVFIRSILSESYFFLIFDNLKT